VFALLTVVLFTPPHSLLFAYFAGTTGASNQEVFKRKPLTPSPVCTLPFGVHLQPAGSFFQARYKSAWSGEN
jgi:hypothetical protein